MSRTAPPETAGGGGGDALAILDARPASGFYFKLTLLATLGGFLFGYDTSNIGSALNFVPYHLTGLALGYLVSGASLGAAAGAILAGPAAGAFGRRALLIVDAGIYALGAILSAVTPNVAVLLAARTLIGVAVGADSAIATAYIAEYAPKSRRGSLSMLQQWMITIGILAAYLVALIIYAAFPGSAASVDWRLILGLGAVPALVGLVLRTTMPESPRWLLRHNKLDAVKKAMATLGTEVTDDQVRQARNTMLAAERAEEGRGRFAAWTKGVRRAVIVVCVFFVFQQITGINVPLYYGPKLLGPYFSGGHAALVATTIAGVEVTLIITVFNVATTYFGFRWIDKFGRRALSMGGYTGMIVFALVAALGIAYIGGIAKLAVVMLGLCGFISAFAIGVGGTGWTLQGEVFPTSVRSEAASIGATVDWLANFALIEVFPVWQGAVGLAWVLVGFAGLSVLAILFIFRFLPETKGRSVEEIIRLFEPEARPQAPPAPVGARLSADRIAPGSAGRVAPGSGTGAARPRRRHHYAQGP